MATLSDNEQGILYTEPHRELVLTKKNSGNKKNITVNIESIQHQQTISVILRLKIGSEAWDNKTKEITSR